MRIENLYIAGMLVPKFIPVKTTQRTSTIEARAYPLYEPAPNNDLALLGIIVGLP